MPHLSIKTAIGRRLAAAGLAFAIAAGLVSALWLTSSNEPAEASVTQTASTFDSALATDGDHVALAGDRGKTYEDDRVVIARLEDGWSPKRSPRLVLPDGSRVPPGASMAGHGDTINVFAGIEWYQIQLSSLV